jgi:hypothetical protein
MTDLSGIVPAARRLLCNNVFVESGIGAAGLKAITSSNYYGAAAAVVASFALSEVCRDEGFDPVVHLPSSPEFSGGQCAVRYSVSIRVNRANGSFTNTSHSCWGPINGFRIVENGGPDTGYVQCQSRGIESAPSSFPVWDFLTGGQAGGYLGERAVGYVVNSIVRIDGLPDDCGNPSGGDISIVGDPDAPIPSVSVDVDVPSIPGGPSFSAPLTLNSFRIEKLLGVDGPLVSFDLSGARVVIDFSSDPPDVYDPQGDIEDLQRRLRENTDDLEELLRAIRECTCNPDEEPERISLPFSMCGESAGLEYSDFLVLPSSVPDDAIAMFTESAIRGLVACDIVPVEGERTLLLSGMSTPETRVFFSPASVSPEIVSVLLIIEDQAPLTRRLYVLQGDQSEGKFGHVDFCLSSQAAASAGAFVWSSETYYRLPYPHAEGKIRLTLVPYISFSLYDTGERIPRSALI